MNRLSTLWLLVSLALAAVADTTTSSSACPTVLSPANGAPVVGSGWTAQLAVQGLSRPRGLLFDTQGHLLVVQSGRGIQHITFDDYNGTCLVVRSSKLLVDDGNLNHGIELSADGAVLYASTSSDVYAWSYDAAAATVANRQTLVTNMDSTDHVSRTLLLSRASPAGTTMLLVSRGSAENMDMGTAEKSSGRSQIRAFDVGRSEATYEYTSDDSLLVGWGLRNSVGLAEDPVTGNLYSVENSADQLRRDGEDIHEDDPGEELNFHGRLDGGGNSSSTLGANYGYPHCFALWGTDIPNRGSSLVVGSQFALSTANASLDDATCAQDYVPPRLTFQAHTAPLDLVFAADGSAAYVSFHGSWNRDEPAGYKVSAVAFAHGEPVAAADSTNATRDILSNADLAGCPDKCFRPVGLAWDSKGRLFVTSDATGEVFVMSQAEMTIQEGGGSSATTAGTFATSTSTSVAARSLRSRPSESLWLVGLAVACSLLAGLCAL